jgi:hypothetical protein
MSTSKNAITSHFPPLASNPEYRSAMEKLSQFLEQRTQAEREAQELERLRLTPSKQTQDTDADHVARAEALLSGNAAPDLTQRMTNNRQILGALSKAIQSQQSIVNNVTTEASQKAAEHFKAEHAKRVKRVVAAVEELAQANSEEAELRHAIEALGYRNRLPCLSFRPANEDFNLLTLNGGYIPGWYGEAQRYERRV